MKDKDVEHDVRLLYTGSRGSKSVTSHEDGSKHDNPNSSSTGDFADDSKSATKMQSPIKDLQPGIERGGVPHNTKREIEQGKVDPLHNKLSHGKGIEMQSPVRQNITPKDGESKEDFIARGGNPDDFMAPSEIAGEATGLSTVELGRLTKGGAGREKKSEIGPYEKIEVLNNPKLNELKSTVMESDNAHLTLMTMLKNGEITEKQFGNLVNDLEISVAAREQREAKELAEGKSRVSVFPTYRR